MEIETLMGKAKPIRNFYDVLNRKPIRPFTKSGARIQDTLSHELPYGEVVGYEVSGGSIELLNALASRVAYSREIIAIFEGDGEKPPSEAGVKKQLRGKRYETFAADESLMVRVIADQYFLENSQYISKLSRNEEEVDRNVGILLGYLTEQLHRIPASSTMRIGKRLEDYFAIREEPSLYLTHYMHPYKGKFHPKMVRSLLNYVCPEMKGLVLDNFAGSGTLLVEAVLMGLDAIGVEINPLSVLMTNVKCSSLRDIRPKELKEAWIDLRQKSKESIGGLELAETNQRTLAEWSKSAAAKPDVEDIVSFVKPYARNENLAELVKAVLMRDLIREMEPRLIRDFFMLTLSGAISDATRRRKADFLELFEQRFHDLYLRVYLWERLRGSLHITPGRGVGYVGDTRGMNDMKGPDGETFSLGEETVDGIVNSPPYSTALDYIQLDTPQLQILELQEDVGDLKTEMMGYPKVNYERSLLLREIEEEGDDFCALPELSRSLVKTLLKAGRVEPCLRQFKFYHDMRLAMEEMNRVLKPSRKAAIIIGNNHFKVDGKYLECRNDDVLAGIGKRASFDVDSIIKRELEKSSVGNIRYESVVILARQ